jgi:hypothetical protein
MEHHWHHWRHRGGAAIHSPPRRVHGVEPPTEHSWSVLASPRGRAILGDPPDSQLRGRLVVPPARADIAVIGGGLAAIILGARLSQLGMLDQTVLLDPRPVLGARFFERLDRIQQPILRTPYGHHLAPAGGRCPDLLEFAQAVADCLTPPEREQIRLAREGRPSLVPVDVFQAHTRRIVDAYSLPPVHHRGLVRSVRPRRGQFLLELASGRLLARNVIFATGEEPRRLEGARSILRAAWRFSTAILDDPDGDRDEGEVAVIGGGLTAAAIAVATARHGGHVSWVVRNQERFARLDAKEEYFRTEGVARFTALDLRGRTRALFVERRASVIPEFQPLLAALEHEGKLTIHRHRVITDAREQDAGLRLRLSDGTTIDAARVVSAIGMRTCLAPSLSPSRCCRWTAHLPHLHDDTLEVVGVPGAFVIGASAQLSMGPAARAIQGMRMAADRILPHLTGRL